MKQQGDTLKRTGLNDGDDENHTSHDSMWNEERKAAFKEELNSDAELAAELKSIIGSDL